MVVDDFAFWSNHCIPVVSSLLSSTGSYTPEEQASHVDFFKRQIIANIGPKPTSGAAYLLAHTGSVLETSVNFNDAGKPILRFIFQPASIDGISEALHADMTWFEQLASTFSVRNDDKVILKAKFPGLADIPQCLLGFDLHPSKKFMKAYFSPLIKSILTGENTDKLVFSILKQLQPLGPSMVPVLEKLEAFRAAEQPLRSIDVIGIDCVAPETGGRVKLYTRLAPGVNSFDYIKHHLTLGGALTDETTQTGLQHLQEIWHLLLDEPKGFTELGRNKDEIGSSDPHSGIMISWEIQPGKDNPSPKLYVPLWKFSNSNCRIAEQYKKIFELWGWNWGSNGAYTKAIGDAFGKAGIADNTPIIHTYASFNMSQAKGKYMSSYTSPLLDSSGEVDPR